MDGRVLQVNVSPGGVPKLPVAEASIGPDGIDGDAHHHDAVHGGPHRAISLFANEAMCTTIAVGEPAAEFVNRRVAIDTDRFGVLPYERARVKALRPSRKVVLLETVVQLG